MSSIAKPSDVRVAVVGYGGAFNMGRKHLEEAGGAGMVPTAVTDLDAVRLETAKADFPDIETYASVEEMLLKSEANLVIIITPHNTHSAIATQCLKAGRHVVVEKPFALTTAECDKMIAAAEKNDLLLSTYHNRHWDGCILRALDVMKNGSLGNLVRMEAHMGSWAPPRDWWRSSRSISGGVLFDWGVHLIEYGLQLADSKIVEVAGFCSNGFWSEKSSWKEDTIEDEATAVVRFENGVHLVVRISTIDSNPRPGRMEVTGTKGSYIFDGSTWELVKPKKSSVVREKGANPEDEHWRYYRNVADHLVSGEPLVIDAQWSRRPVHILDLAVRSAKQGKTLKAKHH